MSPNHPLTPKQKALLDYVSKFQDKHGYAPSQSEIAKHFGFKSLGTVQNYLVRLKREGHLKQEWNSKRGLTLVESEAAPSHHSVISLPVLGRVAAGRPIEATTATQPIDFPVSLLGTGAKTHDHFALEVRGDSMVEDGIFDGDLVILRKTASAHNGETIVAVLDEEATLKRFYKKTGQIELHPANAKYKPIVVSAQESEERGFRVAGSLVAVLRRFT